MKIHLKPFSYFCERDIEGITLNLKEKVPSHANNNCTVTQALEISAAKREDAFKHRQAGRVVSWPSLVFLYGRKIKLARRWRTRGSFVLAQHPAIGEQEKNEEDHGKEDPSR